MKLSLQFHATRSEIDAMTRAWSRDEKLVLFWEMRPGSRHEIVVLDSVDPKPLSPDVSRIGLATHQLDSTAESSHEFMQANPDVLTIYLGEQSDDLLRESFLSAITDNDSIGAVWKRIRRKATNGMRKGAWVVGPTGARGRVDTHYYTPGAKAAAESGARILPLAGTAEYILD